MLVDYKCLFCDGKLQCEEGTMICPSCGKKWQLLEGASPCFLEGAPYWGEISREKMLNVIDESKESHWKKAIENVQDRNFINHVSDEGRGWWRYLLPVKEGAKILDIGAGLGAISFSLAKAGYEVTSVDSVPERAAFLGVRKTQDNVHNLHAACASVLDLPFFDGTFDAVIMNGVLEWVGLSDTTLAPDEVQKRALANIFKVLKPGGVLYLAIENRMSVLNFLGFKDPHSGLRFVTLMPRKIADFYSRLKRKGNDYRVYTYSGPGYKSILRRVGFRDMKFYSPLPSYRNFKIIIPTDDPATIKYCLTHSWNRKRLRLLKYLMPLLRILPAVFLGAMFSYFSPDYSIIAKK